MSKIALVVGRVQYAEGSALPPKLSVSAYANQLPGNPEDDRGRNGPLLIYQDRTLEELLGQLSIRCALNHPIRTRRAHVKTSSLGTAISCTQTIETHDMLRVFDCGRVLGYNTHLLLSNLELTNTPSVARFIVTDVPVYGTVTGCRPIVAARHVLGGGYPESSVEGDLTAEKRIAIFDHLVSAANILLTEARSKRNG